MNELAKPELPGPIESLSSAMDSARAFAEKAKSENTVRAYRADWADFSGWCESHGLRPLPASPETVALYAAALAEKAKTSTIQRRIAAIAEAHRAADCEVPTGTAPVKAVIAGIRREKGTSQTRKAPATIETLREMLVATTSGLSGIRDRALLLLGFSGAFRRSELVSLTVEDAEFTRDGVIVTLRRSKTDQHGEGEKIGIPYGSNPDTCPVRNLSAWLEAAGITSGPIFRGVDRHGNLSPDALTGTSVALIIKKTAESAGLDPDSYSGHSLRAGFVTTAAVAEVPEWRIQRQSRHKSRAILTRYIREASLFRKNAASSVGL